MAPDFPISPNIPFIDKVRHELYLNMRDSEQTLSLLSGAALMGFGVTRPGVWRLLVTVVGGILLRRGLTGHCDIYERLRIDTRHRQSSS